MDFAADAVIELATPPRQPARAPADRSGPSFEDHLNATEDSQATQEASRAESNAARNTDNNIEANEDAEAPADGGLLVAQTAPQPAAPILLQLIDLAGGPITPPAQPAPSDAVAAPPALAGAASEAPPAPPPIVAAAPLTPEADSETQQAESTETQGVQQPVKQETAKTSAADTPLAPAPAQTTQQQTPIQVATPHTPAQPAPTSTPAAQPATPTNAIQAAATATAPPRPSTAPVVQGGKTDAPRGNVKAEAAAAKAAEHVAAQKSQGAAPNVSANMIDAALLAANTTDGSSTQSQAHLQATTSTAAAHTQHAVLDQSVARAAPAAAQVAREIVRRFDGETTRFELRLDPPELGRVEVRLEVSRDHRVTAVVAADSPQALSELVRHARDLEQVLQSAGLQLTENGLSFDLRQSRDEGGDGERSGGSAGADGEEQLTETPATARPIGFERWRGVRVDLMI
ncbi:flagellar hook-length control protein FliK [Terricaulis sp.]|uniref:flagellar hook-length control protein FliK n=1 Tax=Terricaulis sp. TaxID=2768686 RepID=UPI002AC5D1F0|nr:flagellar hook-length control protein FliK [Terricaulis sp.]MDZ4692312.1 flagellar hook-length control protein FliK [Terricaulis sp.]